MVRSGIGAENGVLIRHGEAIQTIKEIHTIVFDKTGTITKGKPGVTDIVSDQKFKEKDILYLAASVEQGSEHPLGQAVVREAKQLGNELATAESLKAVTGNVVRGKVDGKEVFVGNHKLM